MATLYFLLTPLKALLAAFVVGQAVSWTYELTYRGVSYSRSFSQSLLLTCLTSAVVMLALAQSLLAGLGLLGVLSLVRFRTTLKSPRDLVFVMAAAALGICSGLDALRLAVAGTVGFCAVAIYLHRSDFGASNHFDGILRFWVPTGTEVEPRLSALLTEHCRRRSLLTVGDVAQGTRQEHAYEVQLWSEADREALLAALRKDLSATDARLLLQETALEY